MKVVLSFLTVTAMAVFLAFMFIGTTPAPASAAYCSNGGCLDVECDDADNCVNACFFVEDLHCITTGPGACSTYICAGFGEHP